MKKIIALILSTVLTSILVAQNEVQSPLRFDLKMVQHIGLSQWSSAGYVNDGLPKASLTELRAELRHIRQHIGFFADMGIGIMPAPEMRSLNLDRMPMPHSGTQYFLRETLSESGRGGASAHFKMTGGLAGKIPTNNDNFTIMPYLGVGFLTMPQRRYEVILKENGSNMQFQTTYVWNDGGTHNQYAIPPLGYVTGRLNFKYNRIVLGLEYTWFFTSVDFYAQHINMFNANIRRDFRVIGNNMNMLGVSLGVSF
jgi:hypothetical protein